MSKKVTIACTIPRCVDVGREQSERGIKFKAELIDGQVPESKGVGLANTRERLATIYGSAHSIRLSKTEPHGLTICIRIPYTPERAPA